MNKEVKARETCFQRKKNEHSCECALFLYNTQHIAAVQNHSDKER